MGNLPAVVLPTEIIEVAGQAVEIRSLSRAEAIVMSTAFTDDIDGAEIYLIARGCDVTEDAARAWREITPPKLAAEVIDGIVYLSGLATKDGPDPQP